MSGEARQGRIVALDVGSARIGVAASDPVGAFAQAVAVMRADRDWMDGLSEILAEYGAHTILIGMPVRTDGTEGPEVCRMKSVMASLAERFPGLEIIPWDERFTTAIATRALLEADVSRSGRKRKVDKIAAALLLQSYLDSNRKKGADAPIDASALFAPPRKAVAKSGRKPRGGYE
ncbi:MAG: Holliday junction resolvase RuvX [Synergistaceae bacterium]|nr:Holliday junction resolvase RuvX [Synergistaceae bacterium]